MQARRHGWQRPLHPLQMVGMAVYCFLVTGFYCFIGPFLGNRRVEIAITAIFSFVALSVMLLFIRCTAIDPSDKTRFPKKRKSKCEGCSKKLNYGFIIGQLINRCFKRMERKILRICIRRSYLDPWMTYTRMEPLLPFPLVSKDDAILVEHDLEDISFCPLCDFEVKEHSKHCRSCNRCVEGFDHHCRWLNNCIGRKNYTTFILLMISTLLMLLIEGGTAIAIFVRCFANKKGMEQELARKFCREFPRGVLAAISFFLVLMTAYGSTALGQLFFFHVVLIRKGMKTYDYILAARQENELKQLDESESDWSSDDSIESQSPKKQNFLRNFTCKEESRNQSTRAMPVMVDHESTTSEFHKRARIDPWKLIKMNKENAVEAVEQAKESLAKQKQKQKMIKQDSLFPLPFEIKNGPLVNLENTVNTRGGGGGGLSLTNTLIPKGRPPGSPGKFTSPRRRVSGSPTIFSGMAGGQSLQTSSYRDHFDLKLTQVSKELETHISRHVVSSVIKDGAAPSPR
ncbi:hypothetical protein Dimus_036093 [Dionaea muscipula]